MNNLIEKVLKLGNVPLANKKCETCIFKVQDYEKEPCFSCRYGKYAGENSNYVNIENEGEL